MSDLHKNAMEQVLLAARADIQSAMEEREVEDRDTEEADDAVLDVAILHAFRIFIRICEDQGLPADAALFAEIAAELADDESMDALED